jgi:hypothetical protein
MAKVLYEDELKEAIKLYLWIVKHIDVKVDNIEVQTFGDKIIATTEDDE